MSCRLQQVLYATYCVSIAGSCEFSVKMNNVLVTCCNKAGTTKDYYCAMFLFPRYHQQLYHFLCDGYHLNPRASSRVTTKMSALFRPSSIIQFNLTLFTMSLLIELSIGSHEFNRRGGRKFIYRERHSQENSCCSEIVWRVTQTYTSEIGEG